MRQSLPKNHLPGLLTAVFNAETEVLRDFTFRRIFAMRIRGFLSSVALLGLVMGLATVSLAGKAQTFTGTVSDAMCGAKHMMEGDPAACLRACVQKGSKYALVVGDKVYTLDVKNKADQDALDKLADQRAKVKGEADGDNIQVSSVSPAK